MLHAELLSALAVARRRDLQEHATTRWCLRRLATAAARWSRPHSIQQKGPTMEQTAEHVERRYLKAA